jgi:hypothetical protein
LVVKLIQMTAYMCIDAMKEGAWQSFSRCGTGVISVSVDGLMLRGVCRVMQILASLTLSLPASGKCDGWARQKGVARTENLFLHARMPSLLVEISEGITNDRAVRNLSLLAQCVKLISCQYSRRQRFQAAWVRESKVSRRFSSGCRGSAILI